MIGSTAVHMGDTSRGTTPGFGLCLMGGPYVVHQGLCLTVPHGSKRLLVFVALHDGRVDRGQAAGTLWPKASEDRAAGNLRTTLWRLRNAGIGIVEADTDTLWMRRDSTTDVQSLNDWAGRLIAGRPVPDDLALPVWCAQAVDLLPGWDDDWVAFERERLRQRLLHGLECLSHQLLARGRCAEAIEAALNVVHIEPLRESGQRALLEAHMAEGNVVEARRVFRGYEELLRRELQVEPGSALQSLVPVT